MISLMGILNVTPDSFSDGGLYQDPSQSLDRALQMQEEGADLIDLGGESTRPGANPVELDVEIRRVLPALQKIRSKVTVPISIDTRKAEVARLALEEGADMVNDISALGDPNMTKVLSKHNVPVILMHMRGEPKMMQTAVTYDNVVEEIFSFLKERIDWAMSQGIPKDKILIDPGIGFGKRVEDNLEIINRLTTFKGLGCPIVFGSSRKSFIRKIYGEDPESILAGSLTTALQAAQNGASYLRVHDVAETRKALNNLDLRRSVA